MREASCSFWHSAKISISRLLIAAGLVVSAAVFATSPASAQDRRQNTPGEFDFYVLSLSWSPSFCEGTEERGGGGRSQQAQCGGRPFSFVVHGLWPQYEKGYPEYCQRRTPLARGIMTSMLDLMPAPRLIYNEWDKHGTCSGLGERGYFETIRKARAAVKIPEDYLQLSEEKTVAPDDVEAAFVKVNPGLKTSGIAVTCNRKRLSEVRICMSKDLEFRDCPEIDRQACRLDSVTMPPLRGADPLSSGRA